MTGLQIATEGFFGPLQERPALGGLIFLGIFRESARHKKPLVFCPGRFRSAPSLRVMEWSVGVLLPGMTVRTRRLLLRANRCSCYESKRARLPWDCNTETAWEFEGNKFFQEFGIESENYCNFAYSDLACFKTGISGSAFFQSVRKS
jgi:hypothetical protein